MATNGSNDGGGSHSLTNYCSYIDPETQRERIGSFDEDSNSIQPLAYKSGTPLSTLYEVIQVGENGIAAAGERINRSDTRLLPPINGRDVLCVGKNYAEHAKEFNKSGYDSSDKVDQPTHPVIFTKRFTSIIADGEEIYPHPKFTKTVDYEGELGVIVGRPGFRISEENAMDYVWGYTIVNDMTARERQRDHKQFYIGKSPDSFCPMGPIAVPAHKVNNVLRVQTHVNGALRQDATTDDLIFSIPFLVKTLSEGQTIMPGDVLATGTPAGVGFGQDPPSYLNPGDEVSVSITGLGRLTNRISSINSQNTTLLRVQHLAAQATDTARYCPSSNLTDINGKTLNLRQLGNKTGAPAVFIHGLGGTLDFWTPLITATKLKDEYQCHVFDFEGHGLSPTNALSKLSIESLSQDVQGIFTSLNIQRGGILFAHSLGCLVALKFVLTNPGLVSKLVLLGPPPSPLPNAGSKGSHARAALVRTKGMAGVVDAVVMAGTSDRSKSANPLAIAATRLSLLGQNPEGYAKACTALAEATDELPVEDIKADTWIITGSEDQVSPPQLCRAYERRLAHVKGVEVLDNVGHWHVYEDLPGVAKALQAAL
ncbi:hypothetical protein M409DRAFT_62304 [Zasmidium cellare ATCC 36951]|uniref:Fumarylacetoacetase-like C-terminal domain-containing protein n=1 Tax=Zasmidium cellare ATCC 36951 TaxID=1080233 RepID=A0A6A6D465_ZASCE|nr:uncharacterized protein M409DRAFT_62304 [Zasmidium cellare ATCC 36951]KAF2174187.1 hypothetical protein M409DRAFT_62304 [Zasmidium cellare ATCC 36951]